MSIYLGENLIAGGLNEELTINNPFSLLDYKYSEYELSNASWLLSNGQWNSGAVYQSVYDLLLQIYNGTVTKAGVSVKLSTETYADTDFVLNTSDTTFRLPIKVLLAGSKRVAGNGMTLGLTDGTRTAGARGDGQTDGIYAKINLYGTNVGNTTTPSGTIGTKTLGVTTDPLKSGIETSSTGLYLYFYVGETVQDANLINAGQALTDIADLKAHSIVDTYANGTSWYRVYSDGWCEQGGLFPSVSSDQDITITLLKPFKDTNYTVNTIRGNTNYNTNVTWYWLGYFNKTNFNFTTRARSAGNGVDVWQACGYIS